MAGFVQIPAMKLSCAVTSFAPKVAPPCSGGTSGEGRQTWIFIDANAASGPEVIESTYIGTWSVWFDAVSTISQTAWCVPGAHGFAVYLAGSSVWIVPVSFSGIPPRPFAITFAFTVPSFEPIAWLTSVA